MESGVSMENDQVQGNAWGCWLLAGAALFSVCCIASIAAIFASTLAGPYVGQVFTFNGINPGSNVPAAPGAPVMTAEPFAYTEKDNAIGNPNAPVRIVEYGDFQCPYCAAFWRETEKLLIRNYVASGTVYFVYRSYGNFIGPESGRAAEAAYCAGEQDRFWEYHDMLFTNQGAENSGAFADERLVAFARGAALDVEKFSNCLQSNKFKDRVTQDQNDAEKAKIHATPTFVINGGQVIEGAQPYNVFVQIIEAILNGQLYFPQGKLSTPVTKAA